MRHHLPYHRHYMFNLTVRTREKNDSTRHLNSHALLTLITITQFRAFCGTGLITTTLNCLSQLEVFPQRQRRRHTFTPRYRGRRATVTPVGTRGQATRRPRLRIALFRRNRNGNMLITTRGTLNTISKIRNPMTKKGLTITIISPTSCLLNTDIEGRRPRLLNRGHRKDHRLQLT